jgi:F-type H+-transporting ATPase subunit epsilon
MKLVITTPFGIAVDLDGIVALRADDATGNFGILPTHADFLAALRPSVVSWRREDGTPGYCAVHGGVLSVSAGTLISIASRDAVAGDDLERLEGEVVRRFERARDEEAAARAATARLQFEAIRQMLAYLRPQRVSRR